MFTIPKLFPEPSDSEIRDLLRRVKRIAVYGLSPKPDRDSHRVAAHMKRAGYEIVPVYPRETEILGAKVFRTLKEIDVSVDLVDVFRRSEDLPGVVDDVLRAPAARSAALWFQLGCVHEDAIARAQSAGHSVVVDRCLMVEHRRLGV